MGDSFLVGILISALPDFERTHMRTASIFYNEDWMLEW